MADDFYGSVGTPEQAPIPPPQEDPQAQTRPPEEAGPIAMPPSPKGATTRDDFLQQQRQPFQQELDNNPELKHHIAGIIQSENPNAPTAVVESLFNRATYTGKSLTELTAPGPNSFYGPLRPGRTEYINAQNELANNPELAARRFGNIDEALAGSNYTQGHTDQGSAGDPNYAAGGTGVNIAGERFNDFGGGPGGIAGAANWRQMQQLQVAPEARNAQMVTNPVEAPGSAKGPMRVGGFTSRNAAFDGQPTNSQDYHLIKEPDQSWSWISNKEAPQDGTSPFYNPNIGDELDRNAASSLNMFSPEMQQNQFANFARNLGPGAITGVARLLDTPGDLVDTALHGLSWAMGTPQEPLGFHFGGHAINLPEYLGLPHDATGAGWGTDLGYGAGVNLGYTLPLIASGMGMAGMLGRSAITEAAANGSSIASRGVGRYLLGFLDHPMSQPIEEAMLAGGAGVGGGEAHGVYTGATGRSGDVGDMVAQVLGGGVFNAARLGAFELGKVGFEKAWGGATTALSKIGAEARGTMRDDLTTGPDGIGRAVMDPTTGKQVANAYLSGQFQDMAKRSEEHFNSFNTVSPTDSPAYMEARMNTIHAGTQYFLNGIDAEEQRMMAAVNQDMPRNFGPTQRLFQQMKADHFEGTLNEAKDFPTKLEPLLFPAAASRPARGPVIGEADAGPTYVQGTPSHPAQFATGNRMAAPITEGAPQQFGLSQIDTFGRGNQVRQAVNNAISQEMQKAAPNQLMLGYLKKTRDSLLQDMTGAEGSNPAQIEAFRGAMSLAAQKAKLIDTPQIQQILTRSQGAEAALQQLLSANPTNVQAATVLKSVADDKYGTGGVTAAMKDVVRQRYVNSVAPDGYVSMRDHQAFMAPTRYGSLLAQPGWEDVRSQLEGAARNEQNMLMTPGYHGGTQPLGVGFPRNVPQQQMERAELYAARPLEHALNYIENVPNKAGATDEWMRQLAADPRRVMVGPVDPATGLGANVSEAQAGAMHVIAGKVIADPEYAVKNQDMLTAIDKYNPGFTERALAFSQPTTASGLLYKVVDLGARYVGARLGGSVARETGSSFVMASAGSQAMRELASTVGKNMAGIKSTLIVDGNVAPALSRAISGEPSLAQKMTDAVTLHAAIPGFYLSSLANPAISGGLTGHPQAAASGYGPSGQPWWTNQLTDQGQQPAQQPAERTDYGQPAAKGKAAAGASKVKAI